MSFGYFLRN